MPQSLCQIGIHLVYSTRNREPLIPEDRLERVFSYLAGALNNLHCPTFIVGGRPDHVHLYFALSRTMSISQVVEEVKKESSKWAKVHIHPSFYWQNGYAAFSVSPSNADGVRNYIAEQETHHRVRTFQDEYRALLQRHGLEWNEQYLWD